MKKARFLKRCVEFWRRLLRRPWTKLSVSKEEAHRRRGLRQACRRHIPTFIRIFVFLRETWFRVRDRITSLHGKKVAQKILGWYPFNSVRFEISMIYTLILGVVLISFSGVFYFVTARTLYNELDNELQFKARAIAENIRSYLEVKGEKPQTLQYAVEQTIAHEDESLRRWWYIGFQRSWSQKLEKQDLSEDFVNFVSLDESMLITSKNLQGQPLLEDFLTSLAPGQRAQKFWDINDGQQDIRVLNYPYPTAEAPTHIIQVGISKGPVIHLLKDWMVSVMISIPVILLMTVFVGRLLASRILTPLDRIITTANRISHENLRLKVAPRFQYKEMNRLIVVFNNMLSRLKKSFNHIENFSTHVAHELRTPLTVIRGEAELAMLEAASSQQKRAMHTIINEIDAIIRTMEDMLFLSKTNYHPESFDFQEMDLGRLLQENYEQLKPIAAAKGVQFLFTESETHIIIRGDKLHLRRLFFNLIENAIKFTDRNGQVNMQVLLSKEQARVLIADSGIGIAQEHLPKIFDQFYHADHKQRGTGLGLSIARAIAHAHDGSITVESTPGHGTVFTVTLPLVRTQKPSLV